MIHIWVHFRSIPPSFFFDIRVDLVTERKKKRNITTMAGGARAESESESERGEPSGGEEAPGEFSSIQKYLGQYYQTREWNGDRGNKKWRLSSEVQVSPVYDPLRSSTIFSEHMYTGRKLLAHGMST